jgi:hypothetical protein
MVLNLNGPNCEKRSVPDGVTVSLKQPNGTYITQFLSNTGAASVVGGSLIAYVVQNSPAGTWVLSVSGLAGSLFRLSLTMVPSQDPEITIQNVIEAAYSTSNMVMSNAERCNFLIPFLYFFLIKIC